MVHLIFKRIPCQFGQRLRAPGQPLQLSIRHAGIVLRQPSPLLVFIRKRVEDRTLRKHTAAIGNRQLPPWKNDNLTPVKSSQPPERLGLLRKGSSMKAVTGVFGSSSDAQRALSQFRDLGLSEDRLTLLTPKSTADQEATVPIVSAEQPGMGKAIGALIGAAAGISGGPLLVAALIPGVGPITAIGLLGGAILAAASASVGRSRGRKSRKFHDRRTAGRRTLCL